MKKFVFVLISLILLPLLSGTATAETGHYNNGVEGIKAATLPPPGFYYRMYNYFYNADTLTASNGDKLDMHMDASVYAMANRFIWVSEKKILGANYATSMIIPLVNIDMEVGDFYDDSQFGLGDIYVEPFVLAWHGPRYDAAAAVGAYLPTGKYDADNELTSPGKDFYTTMFTLGGTYYFDEAKKLSLSILSRYEIHSEKDEKDITPGDDFHFEWGLAQTVANFWDVGITGYCQWQVTDDSGSDVTWDRGVHDRVYAIGPEVSAFCPKTRLFVSLKSQWEFKAKDRPEGNATTLTFTKIF